MQDFNAMLEQRNAERRAARQVRHIEMAIAFCILGYFVGMMVAGLV